MISRSHILNQFMAFTRAAEPVLHLHNVEAYEDALNLVEYLMESVGEDSERSENFLITLLSQAIKKYEACHEEIFEFEKRAYGDKADVATLRFLMEQHQLTLRDLPEIGHKSLVCKILSGERNLTKSHIAKLSKRFDIDPALFF